MNVDIIVVFFVVGLVFYYEVELQYCFEQFGVMWDIKDLVFFILFLILESYVSYCVNGVIVDGMVFKLDNVFWVVQVGVKWVVIVDLVGLKVGGGMEVVD